MPPKVLHPAPGVTPGIGFYFAGMEEVRGQLEQAVAAIPDEQLGRPAMAGAHSIGALVLHIGEAEWYWMEMVISGHVLNEDDRRMPCWDVLKDPEAFPARKYSAEFCLNEIRKIRQQTRQKLASFDDNNLESIFSIEKRGKRYEHSLRWILHHLIDHEAQHKGQILMLKRLQGLTNEEFFA